ncbi:MAG: 3-oxoacyl-ACP reductase FabG [Candidatus Aphodousia sp.]|nr:3-oxoacyl-ACP reductase FabG [Sutterella sp.]MDY2899780.1 3-oxoacyl-ACP reductase FabG [Candidatus Aphodousia sp.]
MNACDNKTVFISGSSRGIGRAIALDLAHKGYNIVLHGRTPSEKLKKTAQEIRAINPTVRIVTFDVTDRQASFQVLTHDIETHGMYWAVVVNAGKTDDMTFAGMTPEQWDGVIRTDLDGFYNIVQPLIMPMVRTRRGGRIVAVSSVSGVMGNRGQVNYSAAKAGLIGAVKALALELASRAITVNAVAPGMIETDMVDERVRELALPLIPMKRLGRPEEVASAVSFLISQEASYITRSVIEIDGGIHG